MPIRKKLDDDDIALLEIVEDKVWLTEFLRNTADGESNKALWPKQKWNYRDYQRQILTDETPFISVSGGRAIGKCELATSRVYTNNGYITVGALAKLPSFITYCMDNEKRLVLRRARAVQDKDSVVYFITTKLGNTLSLTKNHPILTPDGWTESRSIAAGDYVAVTTKLPEMPNSAFRWHELRFTGYTILLNEALRNNREFIPRFKRIGKEFEHICNLFPVNFGEGPNGGYIPYHIKGPYASPLVSLSEELGLKAYWSWGTKVRTIPQVIMVENNENIKVFLEAMFAQFGTMSGREVYIDLPGITFAQQLQELLLRFHIESVISSINEDSDSVDKARLRLLDYEDVYDFWKTFDIPGVSADLTQEPERRDVVTDWYRFEEVVDVRISTRTYPTYAIYVYDYNNYISSNVIVHNTVILEDKIIYDVVNYDKEFPVTPEQVLTTANQSQMQPLLSKVIQRFTGSPLLKSFLRNNVNRQEGTMRFPVFSKPFTFYFRIAGSRGENNVVGLHVPQVKIDEAQLYPPKAYTQLLPIINYWEPKTMLMVTGVHNGLRNSVLYLVDQKDPKFKKYRIPSHNNPFYSREQDLQNLRDWGGESDDRYQQLVLGRPGSAAFQVLSRDEFTVESYPFFSYRYSSAQKGKDKTYTDFLQLQSLPKLRSVIMAIDTGFVEPTVITIFGYDSSSIWRPYVRYILTRIDFTEQAAIIDWIAQHYNANTIAIDTGAGGGGSGIIHALMNSKDYAHKNYASKILGVGFNDRVIVGFNESGEEVTNIVKNHATEVLISVIQTGLLRFSDTDHEAMGQLERITKQRTLAGNDRYFIMSERAGGADGNDHIYSSFICFAHALDNGLHATETKRRLGKVSSTYT